MTRRYFRSREQHARRYRIYQPKRKPVRVTDLSPAAIDLLYQRAREAQRKGRAA